MLFFSKMMIDMFSRKVADKFLPIYGAIGINRMPIFNDFYKVFKFEGGKGSGMRVMLIRSRVDKFML